MDKTKTETETHVESLLAVIVCSRLLKATIKKWEFLTESEYDNNVHL